MLKKMLVICILTIFHGVLIFGQTTELSLKIGNNGNLTFNNKFASGNYTELQRFGNGYQGAVEIKRNFLEYFGVKAEASYVNSNFEIDHDSYWPINGIERDNKKSFYEEIYINNSSFNLSASAVVNLGPVRIGVGPEISYLVQSVGRGSRYYFSDSLHRNVSHPVQYRFFSKRKQVYNLNNPDETHAFEVNRLSYGLNANINILVYRPFSIELKTFIPVSNYIDSFIGFENQRLNQTTINGQVSIVYSIPIQIKQNSQSKKRRRNVRSQNKKRFSSARLKKVDPRR